MHHAPTRSDMSRIQIQLDRLTVLHDEYKTKLMEQTNFLGILVQAQHQQGESSSSVVEDQANPEEVADSMMEINLGSEPRTNIEAVQRKKLLPSYDSLHIRAKYYRRVRCARWCSCICH